METIFVDLHAHASLPFLGGAWRRRAQGFKLPALDDALPAPFREPARLHILSHYETFLLGRAAPRERLFRSLRSFRFLELPPGAALIRNASDLDMQYREGYLLAVESLRYISDPEDLERFWALGVRSLQPIHFLDTPWGHSSLEGTLPPSPKGLSGLGRELLAEMGDLGFILDLAHMNEATAEECLARYLGPVMCSHTGLRDANPSHRNISADHAREVFRRGGTVGVTCWRRLLGPLQERENERAAWTRSFCETASALSQLSDGARVSVGSDRGAPIRVPRWFFTPEHLREIEAELALQGWDPAGRRAFLGGDALAFLRESLPGVARQARQAFRIPASAR